MIDVMKGLQMFSDVKVPLLAVVENMSHFICDHGEKYFPFGEGGKDRMLQYLSQPFSPSSSASSSSSENNLTRETLQRCPFISLPLLLSIKSSSSTSSEPSQDPPSSSLSSSSWLRPVVLSSPTSAVATSYQHLAQECIREVFRQQVNAIMVPTLSIDDARGGVLLLRYFTPSSAIEFQLTPLHLRCRDPKSGKHFNLVMFFVI